MDIDGMSLLESLCSSEFNSMFADDYFSSTFQDIEILGFNASPLKEVKTNILASNKSVMTYYSKKEALIDTKRVIINPVSIGLVPYEIWENRDYTFQEMLESHFRRRSSKFVKFAQKLFNALAITKAFPDLFDVVGVMWINDSLFKVDKNALGFILGIKKPNASFFNPHGAFKTHGFREIQKHVLEPKYGIPYESIKGKARTNIRVFEHKTKAFSRDMYANSVTKCKWKRSSIKKIT